jgi:hypothetical protein
MWFEKKFGRSPFGAIFNIGQKRSAEKALTPVKKIDQQSNGFNFGRKDRPAGQRF